MSSMPSDSVSVIVPTIGRPDSLARLLDSLAVQSRRVLEVIIADAGNDPRTEVLVADARWRSSGLAVRRLSVSPPNAVAQRVAAVRDSLGTFLLFLDDDVVLEHNCVERMLATFANSPDCVAVMADFSNQKWPQPTRAWRLYLWLFHGLKDGAWQGRVVGPLLRFGYDPVPASPKPMEWLGTCSSLVLKSAYERAGGFSDFFLHRCTMNEDVDLGLKLDRVGRILLCPAARLAHHHAPGGRVSPMIAAEDDLYNRFLILRSTLGRSTLAAFGLVTVYFFVETCSSLLGCARRLRVNGFGARLLGRSRALAKIVLSAGRNSVRAESART